MEQKKNGLTYIDTVEKQCSNLADQWEKIRNSDVEGNTEE
jgi:flagellin-specific chaperone FliS